MDLGYKAGAKKEFDKVDLATMNKLKDFTKYFAGCKYVSQAKTLTGLIKGEDGKPRTFAEFKKLANPIIGDYNQNWLEAEFNATLGQSRMAGRWMDIEKDKDILPLLKYDTVEDANVRPEHKKLHGIVRLVDDPFWDRYMPKNGWGCRCDVEQLGEDEENETDLKDFVDLTDKQQPEFFRINPGKAKAIFGDDHPYIKEVKGDKKAELTVKKVIKAFEKEADNRPKVSDGLFTKDKELIDVIANIDKVHSDGLLSGIPIKKASRIKDNAEGLFSFRFAEKRSLQITIKNKPNKSLTTYHEIGHYLDFEALASKGTFASTVDNHPVNELVGSLMQTETMKNLKTFILEKYKNQVSVNKLLSHVQYLKDPREVFARAYSQYIAVKSGDQVALRDCRVFEGYHQFTKEEETLIVSLFDNLFKKLGWLKKI